jgi:voltage-gated potassium channel
VKYLPSVLAVVFSEREMRSNLRSLLQYVAVLTGLIVVYAVLFHVIMERVEGQTHSWITGFYWTLVVMTTLGFGDITFTSDIGRFFSLVVLLSGVVLLLVMLPFLFIRLFYAPWLEARVRLRAPRTLPATTRGHVIITRYDAIALGLVQRLRTAGMPYVIVEPDPAAAAQHVGEGLKMVTGDIDSAETYELIGADRARMLVANCEDTTNTNITLTAREVTAGLPIVAVVEDADSVDILQLSGATHVLPLKIQLGEYLANRVEVGRREVHVVGSYRGLQVAELPARGTPFAGQTVRDTRLRETDRVSVVGIWERGRMHPAFPHTPIGEASVIVIAGTADRVQALNQRLQGQPTSEHPVLVIGAGRVGRAAAGTLGRRGARTHVVERDRHSLSALEGTADRLIEGDAADHSTLVRAALADAASVLLTTNDDAMNIYLAVYCRRLKPDLRIVSRITHERNLGAIHRAGADFVLSYATLGAGTIFALLRGRGLVLIGEGIDLFTCPVPPPLEGRALRDSAIGSATGLCVIGLQDGDRLITELHSETVLEPGNELIMIGSLDQYRAFSEAYDARPA